MKMFNLAGKVAIVTGGNGGIGLAMAEGMGSCGAAIVVAARDAAKADVALDHLREAGVRASFLPVDVTSKTDCETLVARTKAEFGRLDILVRLVSSTRRQSSSETS